MELSLAADRKQYFIQYNTKLRCSSLHYYNDIVIFLLKIKILQHNLSRSDSKEIKIFLDE